MTDLRVSINLAITVIWNGSGLKVVHFFYLTGKREPLPHST